MSIKINLISESKKLRIERIKRIASKAHSASEMLFVGKTMQEPQRGSQLGPIHNQMNSAPKANFTANRFRGLSLDRVSVEVHLRCTYAIDTQRPSCDHLRWSCMVLLIKLGLRPTPASSMLSRIIYIWVSHCGKQKL